MPAVLIGSADITAVNLGQIPIVVADDLFAERQLYAGSIDGPTMDGVLAGREIGGAKGLFQPMDIDICLLYTSPSPRDKRQSRMPSSA